MPTDPKDREMMEVERILRAREYLADAINQPGESYPPIFATYVREGVPMKGSHLHVDTALLAIAFALQDAALTTPTTGASAPGEVDRIASVMAATDGLDWSEVCGLEAGQDDCESSTCVAACDEDHDAEAMRDWYRRHSSAIIAALASPQDERVARLEGGLREIRQYVEKSFDGSVGSAQALDAIDDVARAAISSVSDRGGER